MTAVYTALEEKLELVRSELNAEIDRISAARAEEQERRIETAQERDEAYRQRDEARAVARHYYRWNRSALRYRERVEQIAFVWETRAKMAEHERNEARRHLRQLLHALDRQEETDPRWSGAISYNVRQAMRETRKYLKGAPDGEDKANPSPGPSRCSHGATHFVCGMRWRGDGDGGNYDVSLCYDCGRFHVRGLSNGEPFDVSFNLHLQEQLDAVARGVAYYTEEEQPT